VKARKHILVAAGAILGLAAICAIGRQALWSERSRVAWRVRHNLPVQLAGIKYHVPPRLTLYESRWETQGRWRFISSDRSGEDAALYVVETNIHEAPELTSYSTSLGSRRFVKTVPVTLAGKNGVCAEFEERTELSSLFEPPFISVDCWFGPRLGVIYLGKAKGVSGFYRFIQTAE
jgi:hypothetical protein